MSTLKMIVDPKPAPDTVLTPACPQGVYRVCSRIMDCITIERLQLLNITGQINRIVEESGISDGLVHVQSLHTTSAVLINEWDDALVQDVKNFFEQLVKREKYYRHNDPSYSDCQRKNADSHLRGMLIGQTLCLQVRNASVRLGTWQSVILAEFDGPRTRSLAVQISGL